MHCWWRCAMAEPGTPRDAGEDFDARAAARALWRGCERYWRAEEEAVRRYLREHRSPAGDVAWLRLAAYKETRLYRELPGAARAAFDGGQPVPGLDEAQRRVLAEEMRHYRAIAGLVEALGGVAPAPGEVLHFPADRALQAARARMRASGDPIEHCASALVEGGGGAIYRVLAGLGGRPAAGRECGGPEAAPFDRRLGAVFAAILDDEMDHGPAQLSRLEAVLAAPADAARAARCLHALGALRVEMRIEMFSLPAPAASAVRARAAC